VAAALSGEIKLQSDELQPRCANVARNVGTATTPKSSTTEKPAPAVDKGVPAEKPASATPAAPKPAASDTSATIKANGTDETRGQYSVQLAAYDRRSDAEAMLKRLAAMSIVARVEGTAAPYRVRTGRYTTRAAAAEALAELKKRGMNGFVAEPSRE
jgi:cell division protein FtsN